MSYMTDIESILAEVNRATEPVEAVRDMIFERGGSWFIPETSSGIFEIQLAGLVGIGPSLSAAVDDWTVQANETLRKQQLGM